ncbi:hypothetical protein [Pseudooctadecabacter jejudonensis]|uniref:Uncharacterized protein n=1 Tax=Pseudooctadecabacter jejudonensis TaxID=1391910 RepID=A0A1Y5RAH1_9RHOB|nr:hypothetical protein [Pseudooctadecabacter jejudonensis]SLN11743.1 hypothetical protein PSJ8397_00104 [Pseudooctadecabacter jejudonensis]
MRALIYSNCSYTTYTTYLQGAQPDWDVRGVFRDTGISWIKDENTAFLDFLNAADLLLGSPNVPELEGRVQKHTECVPMPGVFFGGITRIPFG